MCKTIKQRVKFKAAPATVLTAGISPSSRSASAMPYTGSSAATTLAVCADSARRLRTDYNGSSAGSVSECSAHTWSSALPSGSFANAVSG